MDTDITRTAEELAEVVRWWQLPEGSFNLAVAGIPQLVIDYVAWLEETETKYTCTCSWTVHPDDVNKPEGKRRIHRGEPDLNCKVHTREGFLLGFLEYAICDRPTTPAVELDPADRFSDVNSVIEDRLNITESIIYSPMEWLRRIPGSITIIDCDGWTGAEWQAQTPITYKEFAYRLSMCTLGNTPTAMVKCPPACKCRSHDH